MDRYGIHYNVKCVSFLKGEFSLYVSQPLANIVNLMFTPRIKYLPTRFLHNQCRTVYNAARKLLKFQTVTVLIKTVIGREISEYRELIRKYSIEFRFLRPSSRYFLIGFCFFNEYVHYYFI